MTNPENVAPPADTVMVPLPKASKKTELKVKAASWATFLASLAGLSLLEGTVADLIPALPSGLNWLAPALSSVLLAAVTWVSGYSVRTRPDGLSQSTVDAIAAWMRQRAPRR